MFIITIEKRCAPEAAWDFLYLVNKQTFSPGFIEFMGQIYKSVFTKIHIIIGFTGLKPSWTPVLF